MAEGDDAIDFVLKVKELLRPIETKVPAKNKAHHELQIIKTSIEEQKRIYDHTSNIYDQLRIKALALIAGEVAMVTFLFSNWNFRKSIHDSDREFFFITGIIFLGLAFGFLLWIISTVEWKMPHSLSKAKQLLGNKNNDTEQSFLEELHDDYTSVNGYIMPLVGHKCKKFNWTVFLLAAGVIIIMVIKFGGPQ